MILSLCNNYGLLLQDNYLLSTRGVSDVGFPIFADADTDADFAF